MPPAIIKKIQEKYQSTVSSGIFRVAIIGFILLILIIIILSEYSFRVVYSGIFASLTFVGIISIWIKSLRIVVKFILIIGAIIYLGENIIVSKVVPFFDNKIAQHIPSYYEWKKSNLGLMDNKFGEKTISIKKELMNSEINKGIFGIITEDSPAYDEKGNMINNLFFKKNQKVMSLGLQSKPQLESSEGMAYVLIANEYGDFVKSRSALIPIRKISWESGEKGVDKKISVKNARVSEKNGWEKIKDLPLTFTGRIFNEGFGPDGERAGTGEIFSGYTLEAGYDYKISLSGTYSKWFIRGPWYHNISWTGWNPQSIGINKPFPDYPYGALMLRIGSKNGLHPIKGKDFLIFTPNGDTKVFAELNMNREIDEYISPLVGGKVKNSTLSLKIERRPI